MASKQQESLRQSYLETTYSVFINDDGQKQADIHIGKALPYNINKLFKYQHSNSAVILTAWNPMSKLLSKNENSQRNSKLKEKLLNLGCLFYPAIGQGTDISWPAEESFFIVDLSQSQAQEVALEFGQFAYVLLELNKPAELIFTSLWFK